MKKVFKYKKMILFLVTVIYIVLTLIELIKYLFVESNLFGLIYMFISIGILFLLVPVTYNYNKYYSAQRISKLIIIILLGLFNSYLLIFLLKNTMNYIDYSSMFSKEIFITKNILKGIIYIIVSVFTVFEFKLQKLIKRPIKK